MKSLDGLYLTSFDSTKIRINKKVKDFYDNLTLNLVENVEISKYTEVVAEPVSAIPIAVPVSQSTNLNPFQIYKYVETSVEPINYTRVKKLKYSKTELEIIELEKKMLEIGII